MIGDSEGNSYESDLHYYLGRKSEDVGPLNLSQSAPEPVWPGGLQESLGGHNYPVFIDQFPSGFDWTKFEKNARMSDNIEDVRPTTDMERAKADLADRLRGVGEGPHNGGILRVGEADKRLLNAIEEEFQPSREAVIIRHGDTKFTEGDKAHGWSREKMTPEGVEEVENMRLKNKPDILIASDLPRTKQTAEIVSKNHGIPFLEESEGLRTWNIGNIQGMDCKQADNILQHYVNNPNVPVPDGESFNDFKSRVLGTIEGFFKMYPGMTPGFVTHSKVQKLLDATEKNDWKSVDADHYINGGEAPGKEKTMHFN